jgi:hypothetical protein
MMTSQPRSTLRRSRRISLKRVVNEALRRGLDDMRRCQCSRLCACELIRLTQSCPRLVGAVSLALSRHRCPFCSKLSAADVEWKPAYELRSEGHVAPGSRPIVYAMFGGRTQSTRTRLPANQSLLVLRQSDGRLACCFCVWPICPNFALNRLRAI